MNRLNQMLRVEGHTPSNADTPSIDIIRVVGPARERLLRRFGTGQMEALEAKAQPPLSPIGVGIATDKGLRLRNEDSAIVMIGKKRAVNGAVPVILAAIADGMGGHAHGDRASAIAIETLIEYVVNNFYLSDSQFVAAAFDASVVDELLTEAMMQAHLAVRRGTSDGGSTLTCVLVLNDTLHVAHVGDSRAYLVKARSIDILTNDHRVIRQLEASGIITPEEASHHPQRNVLYRVLGMDDDFEVDVTSRPLHSPSRLLLCSDGVWGPLSANDIYMYVALGQSPQDICERLIRGAMLRQANDNATAVLLHIPGKA